MEKKTVDAIQAAFKQAMDVFNTALQKALAADASGTKSVAVSAPKRRGRPAKDVVAKPLVVGAPKRRGRPPKIKSGDSK